MKWKDNGKEICRQKCVAYRTRVYAAGGAGTGTANERTE